MMNRGRSRSPVRRVDRRRNDSSVDVGDRKFNPNSDRMVYVTNLSFKMEWKELKDIIKEHAEVSFVEVLKNRDGKSKGVAVVELATREGSKKCIDALHRKEIGGRTLSAVEIRDPAAFFRKNEDFLGGAGGRDRRRGSSRDRRPSPGLSYVGETYGLSQNFLESLGLKLPLVNRVFITNIDYGCGVGKLYDVFAMAGRVTWFDLQMDKDGKSRGMAIVEYSHPIEAVQAISMLHNQRLLDRTLTVKMDRFEKEQDRDRHGLPMGLKSIGMGLGANGTALKDIASVVGQIQQPVISLSANGSSSGIAPLIQPASQPSYPTYQQVQPSAQPLASVPVYNQQSQAQQIRQVTPPPSNAGGYFAQSSGYPAESTYKNSPYAAGKQDPRAGFGSNIAVNAQPNTRSALNSYSTGIVEQTPSRVILIKNLPEDYGWNVVAQRLRQFGEFESIDLIGSGVAKVRFFHVQDAERTKATLNGTVVENNTIYVEYII